VLGGQYQNSCQEYRNRGCEQLDSVCKESQNTICTLYEQHYRCPLSHKSSLIDGKFDLEGLSKDSYQLGFEENKDFGEALSALSLASSFAKEQVIQDGQQGAFFGGQSGECEVLPKQCCAQKGVIKNLLGCSEEEEALVPKVQHGICHLIEETKEGIFHQKKRHYCCFNTKLARVAQVGARAQLGVDFGNGEAPNCRALSVAEIQRVDWGRVDFSEIAQDFAQKAQETKLSDTFKQLSAKSINNHQNNAASELSDHINPKIEQLKQQTSNPLNEYYQDQLQEGQHG
jgi:conjugal transfer mating pair stabilization protein TraN